MGGRRQISGLALDQEDGHFKPLILKEYVLLADTEQYLGRNHCNLCAATCRWAFANRYFHIVAKGGDENHQTFDREAIEFVILERRHSRLWNSQNICRARLGHAAQFRNSVDGVCEAQLCPKLVGVRKRQVRKNVPITLRALLRRGRNPLSDSFLHMRLPSADPRVIIPFWYNSKGLHCLEGGHGGSVNRQATERILPRVRFHLRAATRHEPR